MSKHFPEIIQGPGGEIIHDDDGLALSQQTFHEVRPDEPSAAGDQNVGRAQGRTRLAGRVPEFCARISALWLTAAGTEPASSDFSASASATASASFCR